jgi:RND family efflux transporter MFP subunit
MNNLLLKILPLLLISISFTAYSQTTPKTVVIATPEQITNSNTLSLTGSFTPTQQSALSPRVDGLITELLVDVGDNVKKGDKLMVLDAALIRLSISEQKALVEQTKVQQQEAQRLVSEAERLLKQRHISQTELAKRKADLAQSKAQVSEATAALATMQETLTRHTLYAPFPGVISDKAVEVGEWVSKGDAALSLTNLDSLFLDIKVPQEHFSMIDANTRVTIQPDTNPTLNIELPITKVIPVSDQRSRAFLIRVEIDATEHKLIAGTSAEVVVQLPSDTEKAVIVPRDGLLIHPDGGHSVFVIDNDNIAHRKIINVDGVRQNGVLIKSGINIDDKVVIRGNEVLHQGDRVTIEAE